MAAKKTETGGTIQLTRISDAFVEVPIIGVTPLIPHRWSEKAKRMMPGHPDSAGGVKKVKEKRNPEAEAEACLYKLGDSLAMPATAFKSAIIGACRFFDKPSMTEAKLLIWVIGHGPEQLTVIEGTKEQREDTPRNANGNCDLRYRYQLNGWSATIRVGYIPHRISKESVIALVDAAGRGGIGDWRPSAPKSHTGTFGCFRVDETKEIKDVM
jgi:hypothetical protein